MAASFTRPTQLAAFQHPNPLPCPSRVASRRCPCRLPLLRASLPIAPEQRANLPPMSRRAVLHAFALLATLPLLPDPSHAKRVPNEPLSSSLLPLVRVRDSLRELSADVSAGTNGDVRRVVKVVLTGNDMLGSAKKSALWLDGQTAEFAERHAREAFEYLNQVVEYFDATATKEKPRSEVLKFCQMAIDAAGDELDQTLSFFEREQVEQARAALSGPSL